VKGGRVCGRLFFRQGREPGAPVGEGACSRCGPGRGREPRARPSETRRPRDEGRARRIRAQETGGAGAGKKQGARAGSPTSTVPAKLPLSLRSSRRPRGRERDRRGARGRSSPRPSRGALVRAFRCGGATYRRKKVVCVVCTGDTGRGVKRSHRESSLPSVASSPHARRPPSPLTSTTHPRSWTSSARPRARRGGHQYRRASPLFLLCLAGGGERRPFGARESGGAGGGGRGPRRVPPPPAGAPTGPGPPTNNRVG